MQSKIRIVFVFTAITTVAVYATAQASSVGGYSLTVLDNLGGIPGWENSVTHVSADGKVLGGYSSANTDLAVRPIAFTWSAANGWQQLPGPSDMRDSSLSGLSTDGRSAIGWISQPGKWSKWRPDDVERRAVRWPGDGRAQVIAPEGPGRSVDAQVANGDGTRIIGGYVVDGPQYRNAMFLWDERTGFRDLTQSKDFVGRFFSMNRRGDAAVGFVGNHDGVYGSRAILWTEQDGMKVLPTPYARSVYDVANGITDDGRTLVGSVSDSELRLPSPYGMEWGYDAVRWTDGGDKVEKLGYLDGDNYSYAAHISADGGVIVGTSGSTLTGTQRLFVWTPQHGMRDLAALLDAAGVSPGTLRLANIIALSADGRTLTGSGRPGGNAKRQYWQARIDGALLPAAQRPSPVD